MIQGAASNQRGGNNSPSVQGVTMDSSTGSERMKLTPPTGKITKGTRRK